VTNETLICRPRLGRNFSLTLVEHTVRRQEPAQAGLVFRVGFLAVRMRLWYFLYGVEWIRRYLRTPPDRWTPAQRQAFHQWGRETHEWNRRFHGPRTEHDSPYDPRWPTNEHDEKTLLALRKRKAHFRELGYTWVRPMTDERSEQAWLADWREWGERSRARAVLWG